MLAGFLISLREGLEAALVIGIVVGVLHKLNRPDLRRFVWLGVAAAVVLSLAGAYVLALFGMELEGVAEYVFEGVTMLLAAGVLTWMIFWMQKSSVNLKSEIETQIRGTLKENKSNGLFALSFLAVFREGLELVLFITAVEKASSPFGSAAGLLLGLAVATLLGWMLFTSTIKLNLRGFFNVINILLVIVAAGLVAAGVHELNEAGIIPAIVDPVWNINGILSDQSQVGLLLKALVGYNGNPSLTELLAYLLYLSGIGVYLFSANHKQPVKALASSR